MEDAVNGDINLNIEKDINSEMSYVNSENSVCDEIMDPDNYLKKGDSTSNKTGLNNENTEPQNDLKEESTLSNKEYDPVAVLVESNMTVSNTECESVASYNGNDHSHDKSYLESRNSEPVNNNNGADKGSSDGVTVSNSNTINEKVSVMKSSDALNLLMNYGGDSSDNESGSDNENNSSISLSSAAFKKHNNRYQSSCINISDDDNDVISESSSNGSTTLSFSGSSEDSHSDNFEDSDDDGDIIVMSYKKKKKSGMTSVEQRKTNCGVAKERITKTKDELTLDDLPPIEDLHIAVPEDECVLMGNILNIVDRLVVVQGLRNKPALDLETVLFLKWDKPLGEVFDVFGPVVEPHYCVRFNSKEHIKDKDVVIGMPVYFVPESVHTKYVFLNQLLSLKGSDASWKDNNEPPIQFLDYSDDEEERKSKKKVIKVVKKEPVEDGNNDDPDEPQRKRHTAYEQRMNKRNLRMNEMNNFRSNKRNLNNHNNQEWRHQNSSNHLIRPPIFTPPPPPPRCDNTYNVNSTSLSPVNSIPPFGGNAGLYPFNSDMMPSGINSNGAPGRMTPLFDRMINDNISNNRTNFNISNNFPAFGSSSSVPPSPVFNHNIPVPAFTPPQPSASSSNRMPMRWVIPTAPSPLITGNNQFPSSPSFASSLGMNFSSGPPTPNIFSTSQPPTPPQSSLPPSASPLFNFPASPTPPLSINVNFPQPPFQLQQNNHHGFNNVFNNQLQQQRPCTPTPPPCRF